MRRWVAAGQDPAGFWQITPREAMVILAGADARDRTRMRMDQAVAWATARLMMVGFNDPKRFPKFERAFPDPSERRVQQTPDDIFAAMATWAEVARIVHERETEEAP